MQDADTKSKSCASNPRRGGGRHRKRQREAAEESAKAPIQLKDVRQPKPKQRKDKQETPEHSSTAESHRPAENPEETMSTHLDSDDFFEVLDVDRSSTDAEIKKAYRKLAVQWHPDKNRSNPKAEEYFKKIAQAYEVLSDPLKRRHYERYGRTDAMPADQEGHDFAGSFSSHHARDIFEAFFNGVDPFESLFGDGNTGRSNGGGSFGGGFGSAFGGAFGSSFGGGMFGDFGFGGSSGNVMMDSFFSSGMGGTGGSGFSGVSQSVSSSSYTDRNGYVVTKKTTTTTDVNGETKTITEEFRNGQLINSTTSVTNRLADAGRMQLENGIREKGVSRQGSVRGHISKSRSRGRM